MTDDITALIDGALTDRSVPPAPDDADAPARRSRSKRRARRQALESPYAAYTAELERSVPTRTESRGVIDRNLLTIVALVLSVPALRAPMGWLVICSAGAVVMLTVDSVHRRAAKYSAQRPSAEVPYERIVGRVALGVFNPVNWLTTAFGAVIALVVGVLIAAAIATVRWLLLEGMEGTLPAARIGVWAHALMYASVVACFLLLRAGGRTARHRQAALRKVSRTLPDLAFGALLLLVALACTGFALGGPRLDLGFVHANDSLGWVPSPLRSLADDGRNDLVKAEVAAVASCLDNGQQGLWVASANTDAPIDDPDVVTLVADPARPPDSVAIAMAALAADNHVAPWVETIEVKVGDQVALIVDRRGVKRDAPIFDAAQLQPRTVGTPQWLVDVAPQVDRAFVLRCSAQTPL